MESFKKYLQQFPQFQPKLFEQIQPMLREAEISAGEFFLRQGKTCSELAFIESGLFRLYYINEEGKEITHCFCRENSISCAYSSLIKQEPSDCSIQAVEDSKVFVLTYDSLQQLLKTDIFWQQVGRLAAENEYLIAEYHNKFLRDYSATDRYLQVLENDPELLQRVPLNHLATYIQVAPETLSRIRKKIGRT